MTWTLAPDDRPTPRVVTLASRGGVREHHWKNVRRRIDPLETTPFVAEPTESVVEECARWIRAHQPMAEWIVGVAIVLLFIAIAVCAAYDVTLDSAIEWIATLSTGEKL